VNRGHVHLTSSSHLFTSWLFPQQEVSSRISSCLSTAVAVAQPLMDSLEELDTSLPQSCKDLVLCGFDETLGRHSASIATANAFDVFESDITAITDCFEILNGVFDNPR